MREATAWKEGFEEGFEIGLKKGLEKWHKEIVVRAHKSDYSMEDIAKITGFPFPYVKEIVETIVE